MSDGIGPTAPSAMFASVPPPRRGRTVGALGIHAVELITGLGLLPLAASIVDAAAGLPRLSPPRQAVFRLVGMRLFLMLGRSTARALTDPKLALLPSRRYDLRVDEVARVLH